MLLICVTEWQPVLRGVLAPNQCMHHAHRPQGGLFLRLSLLQACTPCTFVTMTAKGPVPVLCALCCFDGLGAPPKCVRVQDCLSLPCSRVCRGIMRCGAAAVWRRLCKKAACCCCVRRSWLGVHADACSVSVGTGLGLVLLFRLFARAGLTCDWAYGTCNTTDTLQLWAHRLNQLRRCGGCSLPLASTHCTQAHRSRHTDIKRGGTSTVYSPLARAPDTAIYSTQHRSAKAGQQARQNGWAIAMPTDPTVCLHTTASGIPLVDCRHVRSSSQQAHGTTPLPAPVAAGQLAFVGVLLPGRLQRSSQPPVLRQFLLTGHMPRVCTVLWSKGVNTSCRRCCC